MNAQIIDLKKVKTFKYSDDGLKVEFIPLEKGLSFWHRNQMKLRRQYRNRNKLMFTDYFLLKKYPEVWNISKTLRNVYSREVPKLKYPRRELLLEKINNADIPLSMIPELTSKRIVFEKPGPGLLLIWNQHLLETFTDSELVDLLLKLDVNTEREFLG